MARDWLTEDLAGTAPVPLLWWDRARPRSRDVSGAQVSRWAASAADGCRDAYLDVVGASLDTLGLHPATGRLVVTYQSLHRALRLGQREVLGTGAVPSPEGWPEEEARDAVTLVLWGLAHEFVELVLDGCTMGHALTTSDRMDLGSGIDPGRRALGWANAAVLGVAPSGSPARGAEVHLSLALAARAQRERWPVPPYLLDRAVGA